MGWYSPSLSVYELLAPVLSRAVWVMNATAIELW